MARRYIRDARGRFAEVPGLDEQINEMGVGGNADVLDDLLDRIQDDLKYNDPDGVTVKIPSGSEVRLSRKLAKFLTGDSDEAPPKQKAQRLLTHEEAVAQGKREKAERDAYVQRKRDEDNARSKAEYERQREEARAKVRAEESKPTTRVVSAANLKPGDVMVTNGVRATVSDVKITSTGKITIRFEGDVPGMGGRVTRSANDRFEVERPAERSQAERDQANKEYFESFKKKSDPFSEGNKDVYGNPAVNSQTAEDKAKVEAANERFRELLKKEEEEKARNARNKEYFESFGKKQDLFSEGNKDVYGNDAVNSQTAEQKAKVDAANKRFAASLGGKNADGSDPGATPGPTNQQKIDNAAKMYGVGSPQHQEAQRRFGPTAAPKPSASDRAEAKRERARRRREEARTKAYGEDIDARQEKRLRESRAERAAEATGLPVDVLTGRLIPEGKRSTVKPGAKWPDTSALQTPPVPAKNWAATVAKAEAEAKAEARAAAKRERARRRRAAAKQG